MSVEALMLATKNWLQAHLTDDAGNPLSDLECDLTVKGQPIPMAGEEFIGIHEAGWDASEPTTGDYDLGEVFGILITVTRRTGQYPVDKIGPELLYKWSGLLAPRCRHIIKEVHRNFQLRLDANTIIASDGSNTNGFLTELWSRGAGPAEIKGPDWFYAKKEPDGSGPCGVCRTLKFGRAERQQLIGEIT